jgi:hypothetical protein
MKNPHRLSSTYRHLKSYVLGIAILFVAVNLQANELDVVLTDQEQQMLRLAEQKRQLKVLNSLLPALQELTAYSQSAITLLIDNNKLGHLSRNDKHLLKEVIQALREDSSAVATSSASESTSEEAYQAVQSNFGITTLFALAPGNNRSGQVVFQLDNSQQPIIVNIGQSFKHLSTTYRLLNIQAVSDGFNKQFHISLQTPQGVRKYRWPELL